MIDFPLIKFPERLSPEQFLKILDGDDKVLTADGVVGKLLGVQVSHFAFQCDLNDNLLQLSLVDSNLTVLPAALSRISPLLCCWPLTEMSFAQRGPRSSPS